MIIGLSIILLLVLILPFTKIVERNLEVFLFIMGIAAVTVSKAYSWPLIKEALVHPISITLAVLIAGLLFRWFEKPIEKGIVWVSNAIPYRLFIMLIVVILGLVSSVITAIVAAVVLVAVISVLRLDRKSEIRLVVLSCFAIGMGAVLTPIGEPLSTIVVSKLDENFFYLLKLVGSSVIPGVLIFGLLAAMIIKPGSRHRDLENSEVAAGKELEIPAENEGSARMQKDTDPGLRAVSMTESYREIIARSLKIYLFVMALTFLGAGFEPFIEAYVLDLSPMLMYWINMVSAVLDNATLAAAEISPAMHDTAVKDLLMGLLISGGMLIPGNIPNIIAAGKLRITSSEYTRFAFPIGLVAMGIYFVVIVFTN